MEIASLLDLEIENVKIHSKNSIKTLIKLHMHDQYIKIRNMGSKVFLVLEDKPWGNVTLIFKNVEKFENSIVSYPRAWLYEEIFIIEPDKYEINVLFDEGEISVVFTDFEIEAKVKDCISNVLSKYTDEQIETKMKEIKDFLAQMLENSSENDELNKKESLFGEREQFISISGCINEKKHFVGEGGLTCFEKDIALISIFIDSLIFGIFEPEKGHTKAGFQNLKRFSKTKRKRIIKLLSSCDLAYISNLTQQACEVIEACQESQCDGEDALKIKKLNEKFKRRYGSRGKKADGIFKAIMYYIRKNAV